jgi:hypothetical protein
MYIWLYIYGCLYGYIYMVILYDYIGIECGETKDYNPCVRGPPTTCADYLRNVSAPSTLNTECREGCICKPGYVLDDQECVKPEDCGCIYNDDYYQVSISFFLGFFFLSFTMKKYLKLFFFLIFNV